MNTYSASSSRAALWTLIVAVALPVLYVLSAPAVAHYVISIKDPAMNLRPLRSYCTPYEWLVEHTFLEVPLSRYRDWWLDNDFNKILYYVSVMVPPR